MKKIQKETREIRRVAVRYLSENTEANYKELKSLLLPLTSRPDYHLGEMVEEGILERVPRKRGFYRLSLQTIAEINKNSVLAPIAILGSGEGKNLVLENFSKNGFTAEYFQVKVEDFEIIEIFKKAEKLLKDSIKKGFKVFIDLTGANSLVIALAELAHRHNLPRLYLGKILSL